MFAILQEFSLWFDRLLKEIQKIIKDFRISEKYFIPNFEDFKLRKLELKMSLLRTFGKKQLEIASQWMGSAATYGAVAGITVTYMFDWKLVLQYLPYYNGKYPKEVAE